MRTQIEIDDALMAEAKAASGLESERAVVEEGLRLLVRRRREQGVKDLFGKLRWEGEREERRRPREGWDDAFSEMAERGDDEPFDDAGPPSSFDEDEWRW